METCPPGKSQENKNTHTDIVHLRKGRNSRKVIGSNQRKSIVHLLERLKIGKSWENKSTRMDIVHLHKGPE